MHGPVNIQKKKNLYSFFHGFRYTQVWWWPEKWAEISHLCNKLCSKLCSAWRNSYGCIYWLCETWATNHSSKQHQVPEGTKLQITIRTINAIYKRKNKSCWVNSANDLQRRGKTNISLPPCTCDVFRCHANIGRQIKYAHVSHRIRVPQVRHPWSKQWIEFCVIQNVKSTRRCRTPYMSGFNKLHKPGQLNR